jgi:hypothetical protein
MTTTAIVARSSVAPDTTRRSADRRAAIWVGVLFIVGSVAGVLSNWLASPVLTGSDLGAEIKAHGDRLAVAALFVLVMGLALALVPLAFHPVARRQSETLSIAYIVARSAVELLMYTTTALIWLTLVAIGRGGTTASSSFVGDLRSVDKVLGDQVGVIPFVSGALVFSYLLYRGRLVPRWMSLWGLAGAGLYLVPAIAKMFGAELGFLMIPLAIQEMILAVWLIARGFEPERPST